MTSARFPRFSTTLDHATAAALAQHAGARQQSRADFVRDAIQNELRIRHAATEAAARERERQAGAAQHLAEALARSPDAAGRRASAIPANPLNRALRCATGDDCS